MFWGLVMAGDSASSLSHLMLSFASSNTVNGRASREGRIKFVSSKSLAR